MESLAGRSFVTLSTRRSFLSPSQDERKTAGENAPAKRCALRLSAAATPLKRLGTVEEIGHAVAFLASEQAGFIKGQTIVVDGGKRCRSRCRPWKV